MWQRQQQLKQKQDGGRRSRAGGARVAQHSSVRCGAKDNPQLPPGAPHNPQLPPRAAAATKNQCK
jgi:hypothetical protein